MPLTNYVIRCDGPGCSAAATYKIASRWSDGLTGELKTYSLCCESCLEHQFRASCRKRSECRLAPDETLESPGIYALSHGQRDPHLVRLVERERSLTAGM